MNIMTIINIFTLHSYNYISNTKKFIKYSTNIHVNNCHLRMSPNFISREGEFVLNLQTGRSWRSATVDFVSV